MDMTPKVCYVYTEYGSKNRSGGMKQLKIENKVVHQFESPGKCCHVTFLDTYMLKVPKSAIEKDNPIIKSLHGSQKSHWEGNTLTNMNKNYEQKGELEY